MDNIVADKIHDKWTIPREIIYQYESFFYNTIRPVIRTNYLSHLVSTVENMVNNRRMERILSIAANTTELGDVNQLRNFLASKTFRLYSIIIIPVNLRRRATTRYHPSGAIIYYNSCYEEKIIRILIAHEIGHIVNKELMDNTTDSEQTANLFAYIAMFDKNEFYTKECEKYISKSDVQILDDIISICPV